MGWVYGVRIWQGLGAEAPGWGRGPQRLLEGWNFSSSSPPRGGHCGVDSATPSQTGSLMHSPPRFGQLPQPAVPAQSAMSSFPSGGEAAQGEGRAWQHQCAITGMSEDRVREHGEHGREWRARLRETWTEPGD